MVTQGETVGGLGQAGYRYEQTADGGCRVEIASGREVQTGSIEIGADCKLSAKADALTGAEMQLQMIQLLNAILQRLPTL